MPTPPLTAWEQAAIVVIFAFLLLGFLTAFFAFARSILKTIQTMSIQFQNYITARDIQWQQYFEDREQSFKERNEEVVNVLRQLVEKFQAHAEESTRAIATMQERTKTRPRKPS